jgi:hypothetical protein
MNGVFNMASKGLRLELKKVAGRYRKIMEAFDGLYFYGCEVDKWLGTITLLPYITLQWAQDPTWYRLIAPPGSGKSQHLSLLEDYEKTYVIDEFTPKSFVSGFRGNDGADPSKLPQFDGKVVIISDESTLMEQRLEDRNQVQSILRKAYDGRVSKDFGNMEKTQSYKSDFNMLIGSTPAIDRYTQYNQALGERYMNFRLQVPNRKEIAIASAKNMFKQFPELKKRQTERMHKFLSKMPTPQIPEIPISEELLYLIIDTADLIALLRTQIIRDKQQQNVLTLGQPETGGRLVKQLLQTAIAFALVEGSPSVKMRHIERATYIGVCSMRAVPAYILYTILKFIKQAPKQKNREVAPITANKLHEMTGFPRRLTNNYLEDLVIHRIATQRMVRKNLSKGGGGMNYMFSKNMIETIERIKLYKYYREPSLEQQTEMKKRPKTRVRLESNKTRGKSNSKSRKTKKK